MPTTLRIFKKKGNFFLLFSFLSFLSFSFSFLNKRHNTNIRSIFDFPFHFPDSGVYLYLQLTIKLNILYGLIAVMVHIVCTYVSRCPLFRVPIATELYVLYELIENE